MLATAILMAVQTSGFLALIYRRDPVARHILRHPFTPYTPDREER